MEIKAIDTIEINGKKVEIPRKKRLFESRSKYLSYLTDILRDAFPYDEDKQKAAVIKNDTDALMILVRNEEDYEKYLEFYAYDLWNAANEKEESLGERVKENIMGFTEKIKNKKSKEKENDKGTKKTTLIGKLLKPVKFIGKVILFPVTVVLLPVKLAKKGIKALFKGTAKVVKKLYSKMPWSKKKEEDDIVLEEPVEDYEINLEEPVEDYAPDQSLEEAIKKEEESVEEADEELKKGVNEELAKENEEKIQTMIDELKREIERLREENKLLEKKLELAKKQPERDKIWEEYFEVPKKCNAIIENAENDMDTYRYKTFKPVIENGKTVKVKPSFELTKISEENIKNACKQPYTVVKTNDEIKFTKEGKEEYRASKVLSETEDTITITGEYYNFLIKNEFDYRKEIITEYIETFPEEKDNVCMIKDYNHSGLISRNKGINERKVVYDISCTLTKERYKELVAILDETIKRQIDRHNRYHNFGNSKKTLNFK